jgi:hypothetical protein
MTMVRKRLSQLWPSEPREWEIKVGWRVWGGIYRWELASQGGGLRPLLLYQHQNLRACAGADKSQTVNFGLPPAVLTNPKPKIQSKAIHAHAPPQTSLDARHYCAL